MFLSLVVNDHKDVCMLVQNESAAEKDFAFARASYHTFSKTISVYDAHGNELLLEEPVNDTIHEALNGTDKILAAYLNPLMRPFKDHYMPLTKD